jgi:hypothetical protein
VNGRRASEEMDDITSLTFVVPFKMLDFDTMGFERAFCPFYLDLKSAMRQKKGKVVIDQNLHKVILAARKPLLLDSLLFIDDRSYGAIQFISEL